MHFAAQLETKVFTHTYALLEHVTSTIIPNCHINKRQQAIRDHVTEFESQSFSVQHSSKGLQEGTAQS